MDAHFPQIVTSASMLDSIVKIEELSAALQSYEHATVAITDRKLYGLLHFNQVMKKAHIQPVLGLTVDLVCQENLTIPLVLYAANQQGYQHLIKISSAISLREQEDLPLKWLLGYQKGLIVMLPVAMTHHCDEVIQMVQQLHEQLEYFYLGIERANGIIHEQESLWRDVAQSEKLKVMATQRVHFLNEEDVEAYTVAKAIQQGVRVEDREPLNPIERAHYLPTMMQLKEWFQDVPEWLDTTAEVLNQCKVELTYEQHYMPKFQPLEEGKTAEVLLAEQCKKGLQERGFTGQQIYEERLQYELRVINDMGYADYFLIVADYIAFARSKRILTGPGRGSSASSLVAYCLRITNVDPIQYDLLFERFLNPARITLPDIDVDFADAKRQEVIEYVAKKYGASHTAQIITFGTLSAKAVARDVARVLGFTMEEMAQISALIPSKPGTMLRDAEPAFEQWIGTDEHKVKWLQIAKRLEGLPRNASTHAAGVILSPIALPEIVPIEKGSDDIYMTQWPMKEVEAVGLLKMDFLGLRNLSILDHIRYLIYAGERRVLDFEKIPLDDVRTYQLLQQGDTTGVFQLESAGMRQALKEVYPTSFLDLVAVNALYRPGPMDFIPVYSRRKHGQEQVVLPHPILAPILNETYGVIVYQEQIMRIASVFAGFTLGEADVLRRAVSKKEKSILDQERQHFVQGALQNGYAKNVANEVYDLIVRFANYGFPKSHAVAYSLITYQMAYLKANFAPYFYAALLTSVMGDREKQLKILQEVRAKGIPLLRPSIQKSGKSYRVENGSIRLALGAIRGVPQTFLKKLQQMQQVKKEWKSIFDMALSISAQHFKEKTIEALIKAGALDDFEQNRETLLATVSRAENLAKLYAPDEETTVLYDTRIYGVPKHAEAEPMIEKEKLQGEKEVLGFYISKHPVEQLKAKMGQPVVPIHRVSSIKIGATIQVIAAVQNIKVIRTKNGEQMAFLTVEDETAALSITVFPKVFEQIKSLLEEDSILYIEGKVESRQQQVQLIAQKIQDVKSL